MLKRTPLFESHQKLGAKLIDFGGWEMPVQYTSIVEEHLAVRDAAGIFDISHMGEVTVSGAGAEDFLNRTLTNNIRKLASGQGQYTIMCNERGGAIDDLYAYRLSAEVYLLIINAAQIEADVSWLQTQAAKFSRPSELQLTNASHHYAAVAAQGPRVPEFIGQCIHGDSNCAARVGCVTDLKKNQIGGFPFRGADVLVSRTGYTGEDGFEIIGRDESIRQIWDSMLEAGQAFGIKPCGLGARDTLRTEVCYPLYGHELDEDTTPIEAGLGSFVSLDKGEFVGHAALAGQKVHGVEKKLMAFKMTGKSAPPRPHYPIWANGAKVGMVTSGTQSPSLGIGIGMGYVPPELAGPETRIEIEIRGKSSPALTVKKPIYQPTKTQ
jgi:glycine cleavage system T protein (aminomethyltransferase)